MVRNLLGAGLIVLAWAGNAQALVPPGSLGGGGGGGSTPPPPTVTAPEIDPASAASGLALLVGGVLVLRGRKPLRTEI